MLINLNNSNQINNNIDFQQYQLYILLFSYAANDNSDNMSEQVDMVEVKTEPNEFDDLNSVCKNTNMVDSHSRQDKVTIESKIQI